jgi:hypothetical protein
LRKLRPVDIVALYDEIVDRSSRLLLVEILNLSEKPARIATVKRMLISKEIASIADELDSDLLELRDQLREALASDALQTRLFRQTLRSLMESVPLDMSQPSSELRGLVYVTDWGERRERRQSWFISWEEGVIRPLPDGNFRGTLAWAIIRHGKDLGKCANPECPNPYYLRRRRDQKYCSANDECARFANRKAALRYWHKNKGVE